MTPGADVDEAVGANRMAGTPDGSNDRTGAGIAEPGVGAVYLVGRGDSAEPAIREMVEAGVALAVSRYADGPGWLAAAPDVPAGCVVFDWDTADASGLDTLCRTASGAAGHVAVVLTASDDVGQAVAAMRAGAADLLCRPIAPAELARTIGAALDAARRGIERRVRADRATAEAVRLSPRERQVLAGLVAGRSGARLAGDLGLDVRAVAACRARLMRRTGSAGLVGLIRFALEAGLPMDV